MEEPRGTKNGARTGDTQAGALQEDPFHAGIFQFNSWLFCAFLVLAGALWRGMPDRYPVHFDLFGTPTRWAEGPGMWVLLVALASLSFGKMHLFQRFLLVDPDSPLLNLPEQDRFQQLPRERKIPVVRRANRMLGLLNAGLLLVYVLILLLVYTVALYPESPLAVLGNRALLLLVASMLVLPLVELAALRRMIHRKLEEEGIR